MGMNLKAITNIQRQADILSDGHQEVVDQAVAATAVISRLDDRMEESKEARRPAIGLDTLIRLAQQELEMLQEQLVAQAARAIRVRSEIKQIQKNLRVT